MSDKSAFDHLLDLGAAFDWISPGLAILQHAVHGGGHTFTVPAEYNREVRQLLRGANVRAWGGAVVGENYAITVPREEAERAQAILARAKIPILSGWFAERKLTHTEPIRPRGKSRLWALLDKADEKKRKR